MRTDNYQDEDGTQRYYPQGNVYDHELYPEVETQRQSASRQQRQPRRARPQAAQRETTADLKQVDNSQVAGRVAYDEDGNLVVVKKEEKSSPVQMAAIIGSALSAVTSAFFSSHIGIGGSVLTVAIGAAVSAAATQLYTHLIKKSTDKLKSVAHVGGSGSQQLDGVMDSSQLDGGYGYGAEYETYGSDAYGTYDAEGYATAGESRVAPQGMIDAAANEEHERQIRRRGIIITAIAALIAVIVAAGVVTLATNGNGIGTKTPSIVSTITTAPANTNENVNANENAAAAAANANKNSEAENGASNTLTVTEKPTTTDNSSTGAATTTTTTTDSGERTSTTSANTSSANGTPSSSTTNTNTSSSSTSGKADTGSNSASTSTDSGSGSSTTGGSTTTTTTDSGSSSSSSSSVDTQSTEAAE